MKIIELDGLAYNLDNEDELRAFQYQYQVLVKTLEDKNKISLYNQGRADQKKKDAELCMDNMQNKHSFKQGFVYGDGYNDGCGDCSNLIEEQE